MVRVAPAVALVLRSVVQRQQFILLALGDLSKDVSVQDAKVSEHGRFLLLGDTLIV